VRSNPADFELISPRNLPAALALLSGEPGAWAPIAGGTDLMVLYAAGKLAARRLLNIWGLPELRRLDVLPSELRIGSTCTYTEIRNHPVVQKEFPLLAAAASWTGGIANQNRGTLGGNIANASPAADSLPALLVYGADLILVSSRGERRVPYGTFHTGYKKMLLEPDELIHSIIVSRRSAGFFSYSRKVGARKAQAISKVCIAALAQTRDGMLDDVRIALGSVAPVPLRLRKTEQFLAGKPLEPSLSHAARALALQEITPIDDIRSTSRYRSAVVANLLADFLTQLSRSAEIR
jgi:CO/xanthine dehydrogenase FAD-binding subunit